MSDPGSHAPDMETADAAQTILKLPDRVWSAIRTKPRQEKRFHAFCEAEDITCYLPLRRSVRHYKYRVKEFRVPLFPGYAFVQVSLAERATVEQCRHTATVLTPDDSMEDQLVNELRDIQKLEEAAELGEIVVRPEIEVGRTVLVKTGPLAGLNGIVTRRKNKIRLTVNVEMVGQSVSLEVDVAEVEIDD